MIKAYHKPSSVDEALKLISNNSDKNVPLAGGTSLALNPRGVDGLVDLAGLKLSGIQKSPLGLRIGATTPLREVQRSEQVRQFAGGILAESAKNYLTALIRNRATIAGVLAAGNFWADVAVVLVALNASLRILRPGAAGKPRDVVVPVEEFIQQGPRRGLSGGIISEIQVPAPPATARCAYSRLAKVETDISIVSASIIAIMPGKAIKSVRIVVGNGSRPVRLKASEVRIAGKSVSIAVDLVSNAAADIQAESDIRASAEYRRDVAAVLVRRLFKDLA